MPLRPRRRRAAFTLVEILVALAVVALVVGLAIPKLTELSGMELRSAVRRLAGAARYAADQAAVRKAPYRLRFDFAARAYRVERLDGDAWKPDPTSLGVPVVLPGQVRVAQVETRRAGRLREKEASVEFYPKGYAERAAIQLAVGETRAYTIEVRPYDMRPRVHDGALELEDLDRNATVPAAR
jgi:prepilin-type N-terminal cleavage/methylation domain-containing protein